MAKLIICRGIPGSGKSYWASSYKGPYPDVVIVTRDDIRAEYGCAGEGYSVEKELTFIIPERNSRIRRALQRGYTVISADTNIHRAAVGELIDLALKYKAEWEIKEFDTPLEVCIERDSAREYPWKVGAEKIREYHERWRNRDAVSAQPVRDTEESRQD